MTATRSLLAAGVLFVGVVPGRAAPPAAVPDLPITRGGNRPINLLRVAADGNWAAYHGDSQPGDPRESHRVAVWNLRTGAFDRSVLMPDSPNWGWPVVSPDGRWLAYRRLVAGTFRVQLADCRTGRLAAATPRGTERPGEEAAARVGPEVPFVMTVAAGNSAGRVWEVLRRRGGHDLRAESPPRILPGPLLA